MQNSLLQDAKGASRPVALVTGGTSGIGLAAAQALQARGCRVYTLSRRAENPGFSHLRADVSDEEAVKRALEPWLQEVDHIDILVNCAGYGISGAIEFAESEDVRRQIEVNFLGAVHVTKAVLAAMRKAGRGRIVNVSSVAAPAAIPFQAFYSASKAALNDYTLALASEVRPFGVTVCAVQPGDIRTGFTDARHKNPAGDEIYGGRIARSVSRMESDERGGMDPSKAGAFIARVAMKRRVRPIYTIGFSYQCICLLLKLLPASLVNRLIGLLYAG